jgi:sulfonate transport system substrate-binding protein
MKTGLDRYLVFLYSIIILAINATPKDRSGTIRIGLLGNKLDKPFASGIIGFAQENQAFEQEFARDSIKITWNFFKGGAPALNEAIANGVIDIASYGDLGSISGKGGGLPTRVLFPASVGGGKNFILVSSSSTIYNLNDLKGKRISYQKGTAPQLLWNRLIRDRLGLKENDFVVYPLGSSEQDVALVSGQIDILISSNLDLVDRGSARILLSLDFEKEPKLGGIGIVVATQSFIDKHPDLVQRWVNVYVRVAAEKLANTQQEDFVRIGTKAGTSAKNIRATLAHNLEFYNAPIIDEYFHQKLQLALDDCLAFKFIPKAIKYEKWVEPSFVTNAINERGLLSRWSQLRKVSDFERSPISESKQ